MAKKIKTMPVAIGKSQTFLEVLEEVNQKQKESEEIYKKNGGICQCCHKDKAEYPHGFPSPYNCSKCNAETQKLINQLRGMGGFLSI